MNVPDIVNVWGCALLCAGMLSIPAHGDRVARAPSFPMQSAESEESALQHRVVAGEVVRGRYSAAEGARPWRLFVPVRAAGASPAMLLVVLHGCTQTANDIAAGSRLDAMAEAEGFFVLYPEQPPEANPRGCWNWFDPAHQSRGAGEPAIIAGMTRDIVKQYGIDPSQVHLVGVSAGAAMATLTSVAYAEQFASVTSASGISWRAATTVGRALMVMQRGAGDSLATAEAMLTAMGANARALPALVVHGGRDAVVNATNGVESATQWVAVHDALRQRDGRPRLMRAADGPAQSERGYQTSTHLWVDADSRVQVQHVEIAELGHAWSGGSTAGTFTDAKGPDASRLIVEFCRAHPLRTAR